MATLDEIAAQPERAFTLSGQERRMLRRRLVVAMAALIEDEAEESSDDSTLSLEQAAAHLGMTVDWLYRHKEIPFTRLGKFRRYSLRSLNAWLTKRERAR